MKVPQKWFHTHALLHGQVFTMAAGQDLTLLTDLTRGKVRGASHFKRDAGHWVSTSGLAFSCGDCYRVCVKRFLFLSWRGSGGEDEEEREAETERTGCKSE